MKTAVFAGLYLLCFAACADDTTYNSRESIEALVSEKVAALLAAQKKNDKDAMDDEFIKHLNRYSLLSGLKLKTTAGLTNTTGTEIHQGGGTGAYLGETTVWDVKIGYFDKPIVKDLYLWSGGWRDFGAESRAKAIEEYRAKKGHWHRWALLDAIKLSLNVGYGTTIENEIARNAKEFATTKEAKYFVGVTYEVPLDGWLPVLAE